MPPISEKERSQKYQEKFQAILSALLKEDDNKYCADCDAKGPRWASWNLGVFVCIRCAGIHRNLGVHISRVKSVNLDQWTAEQIASMQAIGNAKGRQIYEANLPDTFRRSQTDSAMEQFIRGKYESKKWIAKEWTQPTITVPAELKVDASSKEKRKTKNGVSLDGAFNKMNLDAPANAKPKKASPNKPAVAEPVKKNEASLLDFDNNTDFFAPSNGTQQPSANQLDLFSLGPIVDSSTNNNNASDSLFPADFLSNTPSNPPANTAETANPTATAAVTPKPSENNDLSDLMMGSSTSAAPATPSTTGGNKAMDINSIMALYGQGTKAPTQFQSFTPAPNPNAAPSQFMNNSFNPSNGATNNSGVMGQSANFQMNQMNMFGQNPYGQNQAAPSSNMADLSSLSGPNLFGNSMNSNSSTMPNIGNTLIPDLWQ